MEIYMNQLESLQALEKLADLKSKGVLTDEEYEVKKAMIIKEDNDSVEARESQRNGFPTVLFLLPILLGILGGIIGALIAAQAYKSRWWQMIAMGIIFSFLWGILWLVLMALH
jgi:tetrahydromethanopterin S-methyltransferase subunit D